MKIFPARILFVYDASRYEAILTLDFGVFVKKTLKIVDDEDMPLSRSGDPREVEAFRAAKRVAMELSLGKKCFAEVEESRKHVWASVFVCGQLDPCVHHREIDGEMCFDVISAIRESAKYGYNLESVGFVGGANG